MKISQEKVSLNFKERLNNGNLWFFFLPFLFSVASWPHLFNRKSNLNLIIFKNVLECVGKVLRETQAYVALGVNFYAE